MSLLDGLLGGAVGAGVAPLNSFIQHGGVKGVVTLEQQGLGNTAI
jgi:hypothetical protein